MSKEIIQIVASKIKPNLLGRRSIDNEQIEMLSESIQSVGLLNPIVVYKNKDDNYIILDGHRRVKALEKIGRTGQCLIPCVINETPPDEIREQELMSSINIHRSSPEDLKREVEIANTIWNTMKSTRRQKLAEEFRDKFIEKHCGEEKYQEAPAQYISNRFRPRIDYIRSITGLDYSNKTVTNILNEVLKTKGEDIKKSEKETLVEKQKTINKNDLIKNIRTLQTMLSMYEEKNAEKKKIIEEIVVYLDSIKEKL